MSDKEARILGAGSVVEVNGREYELSPINLKQLAKLQRTALDYYKEQYLSTYQNAGFLPEEIRLEIIKEKLDEVARWDIHDLPSRVSYDASSLPVTDDLKQQLKTEAEQAGVGDDESSWRNLVVFCLENDQITANQIRELTGESPAKLQTSYDSWWVTGCYEGLIAFILESLRIKNPRMKKSEVEGWSISDQMKAAQTIERITTPAVGNT